MNTLRDKQARIASLTNEVNDFHPLLKLLLSNMPRVTQVEYTHGTNEMGADFVIARQDDTFQDTRYIGVIAKVGKISQDHQDIQRQISECGIERLFDGGKSKIRLTEVWVISTGVISNNAQTKINHHYANTNTHFIPGDKLIALIDSYTPNFWTDVSLAVGDYLYRTADVYQNLDKALCLIKSKEVNFYIDQDLYETEQFEKKRHKPSTRIDIHTFIKNNDVVLIEGDMGSGKSKFIRQLVAYHCSPSNFLDTGLIPVPLSFKDFIDKYASSADKAIESLVPKELRDSRENSRYLLLLDGADEKDLDPEALTNAIIDCAKSVKSCNAKAIITSRWSEGFEQNDNLKSVLKRLELRALSTQRLIDFIRKICTSVGKDTRLIEDLKKSVLLKELPRSPIAAILLAELINENAKDLPSNLTELYAKYTELSLGRWDVDKGLQTNKEFEALGSIIVDLAEYTIDNDLDGLSIEETKGFFKKYLQPRNLGIDPDQLFKKLIERSDLVFCDPLNSIFRFKHRSFAEFFYAKSRQRKPMTIDNRVWHSYWTTVYYFYVGLARDCPEILEAIIAREPDGEAERWVKLTTLPNYLMAGFASPYEITERALAQSMVEASQLYDDIANGVISSPFAAFPKMHFLWLMQLMIRKSYSYEFFKKAIETATLSIEDYQMESKNRAISIFFLSIISREFKNDDCFDYLIKNHQQSLPLEVQLGIRHETQDDKTRNTIVKKLDQRVNRALKDNKSFNDVVSNLYKRPIRLTKPKGGE